MLGRLRAPASVLFALAMGAQNPRVGGVPFAGEWIAAGPTRGISSVSIFKEGDDWFLKASGSCQPADCDIPRARLTLYKSAFDAPFFDRGFATQSESEHVTLTLDGDGITVEIYKTFNDGGNNPRSNIHFANRLVRRPSSDTRGPSATARRLTPVEEAVKAAYEREFQQHVERPAVWDDPTNGGCASRRHVTSTAYLTPSGNRSTLYFVYLSPDGKSVGKHGRVDVLRPAGTIRVLSLLVRYPETVGDHGGELWTAAQKSINGDHEAFAKAHDYKSPLVVFDNTNVVIERSEITNPREPAAVRAAAVTKGLAPERFDIVMIIDFNPAESTGGLSNLPERSIYVGNYSHTTNTLTEREWRSVASTAYHHEMAHHWGWEHDWATRCGGVQLGFEPFIVPPVLLGWEDVDGDGIPEILSDAPYGRR